MSEKKTDFIPNLSRCQEFYTNVGAAMIDEKFHDYVSDIAVGLVGEGSDCFGYDDEISKDHDYEVGFCMWVTEDVYRQIGTELDQSYEELLRQQPPSDTTVISRHASQRRGVFTIREFYRQIMHYDLVGESDQVDISPNLWLYFREEALAAAVNGAVFRDDSGIFSGIREKLASYYPPEIHRLRLADQLHQFSQNGQYNYPRMMARGDLLTAQICVMQSVKSAMSISYLLNRQYAPYYKWMRKGLDSLPLLSGLGPLMDTIVKIPPQQEAWRGTAYSSAKINQKDEICCKLEQIASEILKELKRQKLTNGTDSFLDSYCEEIAHSSLETCKRK